MNLRGDKLSRNKNIMLDPNELMGIAIVGVALSLLVNHLKEVFQTSSFGTKLLTLALSVLVGGTYYWVRQTIWWVPTLGVLTSASTVYAFFLKPKK